MICDPDEQPDLKVVIWHFLLKVSQKVKMMMGK